MTDFNSRFRSALSLSDDTNLESISYDTCQQWTSITHMIIMTQLEDFLNIKLTPDQIIDLMSYITIKKFINETCYGNH